MDSNKKVKPTVTIRTIAKELGLSFSTVSKALNDNPVVNEKTVELVKKKAKELNYYPNTIAKALRSKETKTIGIILNDLENPLYLSIVKKISIELSKYGYTTFICDSQFDVEMEKKNILTILSKLPSSIIISPVSLNDDNINLLKELNTKTIFIDHIPKNYSSNSVYIDFKQAGYISAKTLLKDGHKEIIIITGPKEFPGTIKYIQGIQDAFDEYQITLQDEAVTYCIPSLDNGFKAIMNMYPLYQETFHKKITGVLAFCDMIAYGVYKGAAKLKLKIPDDLSIIGFDDNPLTVFSTPPLTTIHHPKEKVAEHCVDILISRLVKHEDRLINFFLEPYLVERDSVANIKT